MLVCNEASHEALDLFAEADAAFALECCPTCEKDDEDILSDDEDEFGNNLLAQRLSDARSRCVTLPNGDIHLCDEDCPFAEEDREGDLVCPHTGRVCGRCIAERTDQSTGRSTWSSDPDMQSGTPYGGWGKKRDMQQASNQAYVLAGGLDDTEMPCACPSSPSPAGARASSKRGALCVDEEAPLDAVPKRQRATKRDVELDDVRQGLLDEAERTLLDLLGKQWCGGKRTAKAPAVDPRLLNKEVLFPAVLKKYLKECRASGRLPQMDDVHNISLAVDKVIAEETTRAQCPDRSRAPARVPRGERAPRRLALGGCVPHAAHAGGQARRRRLPPVLRRRVLRVQARADAARRDRDRAARRRVHAGAARAARDRRRSREQVASRELAQGPQGDPPVHQLGGRRGGAHAVRRGDPRRQVRALSARTL